MNGKTLLIVDDQENVRLLLEEVFQGEGMKVLLAGSGLEALELMQREAPDLILLDVKMPQMSGIEFLRRLRAINKDCPAVVMTGDDACAEVMVKTDHLGIIAQIVKPFDILEIIRVVSGSLAR